MTKDVEQITYMLAEAIDKDREYKSWHVSTKHLMTLVKRVVAEERAACADICKEMYLSGDMDTGLAEEAIRARGDGITLTTIRHPKGKPALGDLNPESLEQVEIDLPEGDA